MPRPILPIPTRLPTPDHAAAPTRRHQLRVGINIFRNIFHTENIELSKLTFIWACHNYDRIFFLFWSILYDFGQSEHILLSFDQLL